MKEVSATDGCANTICPKHGFLARVIVGAEVLCQNCRRWIQAIADDKQQKRKRRRERNHRYYQSRSTSALKTERQTAV